MHSVNETTQLTCPKYRQVQNSAGDMPNRCVVIPSEKGWQHTAVLKLPEPLEINEVHNSF